MKSRRFKLTIGTLMLVAIFGWLFAIDRHPEIPYYPTDGLAMMKEYADHAWEDGADWRSTEVQSPSKTITSGNTIPNGGTMLVIEKIDYKKGTPAIIRKIFSLVGRGYQRPSVSFRSEGVDSQGKYHELRNESGGGSGFSTFIDSKDSAELRKLRASLKTLPPNGHIRFGVDFYVIQLGEEVRVYDAKAFPPELMPAKLEIDSFESHLPFPPAQMDR